MRVSPEYHIKTPNGYIVGYNVKTKEFIYTNSNYNAWSPETKEIGIDFCNRFGIKEYEIVLE